MPSVIKEDITHAKSLVLSLKSLFTIIGTFVYGGGMIAQGATSNYVGGDMEMIYGVLMVLYVLFFFLGSIRVDQDTCKGRYYLNLVHAIAFFGLALLNISGMSYFAGKYLIFVIPFFYILVARGMAGIRYIYCYNNEWKF